MACELCGAQGLLVIALIEGAELTVCNKCSSNGRILRNAQPEQKKKTRQIESITVIVGDASSVIKKAREKLGMTQQDFAKLINEKESQIHKLETGAIAPSLELALKMEKILKIVLVRKSEAFEMPKSSEKNDVLTIGDIIKLG